MAEQDRHDRTEQPTEKRLREARERGQVARSRDLSGALVFAAGLAVLGAGGGVLDALAGWMRAALQQPTMVSSADLPRQLALEGVAAFRLLAGCFAAMFVAGLLGQLVTGGWNFSPGSLAPDFNRLNPASNLGRLYGGSPAELGKTFLKALLVGGTIAGLLWSHRGELVTLATLAPRPAIAGILHFTALTGAAGALGLLLVGLLDAPYQIWRHARELRMTKQEIRDEMRESEGRPEVRAQLRRMQQQLARGRMMEAIKDADVVVVNPVHVAVALHYAPGTMRAPKVVAKGAGEIAERIREAALEHHIPLLTAPPLARALYRSTRVDGDVPASLYRAVAQVLAWVYQLRTGSGDLHPPDVELPPEMTEAARPWN